MIRYILALMLAIPLAAQTATINGQRANFRVLVGSAAPSSGTCDAASERGSIYLRTGDQASVPSQMYVCKQSGASTYGWGPAGWVAQAAAPATCAVGEFWVDTDATPSESLYVCTSTNTWTLQSGGGGTGDAAEVVAFSTNTCTATSNTSTTCTKTLTGNVASCTLAGFTAGQLISVELTQDGTGGRTFACSSLSGLGAISTVASKTSRQLFRATSASAAVAVGSMVTDETSYSVSVVPTGDITMTLPSTSFTAVGEGTTQTLTNKTLTSPTVNDGAFDLDAGTLEVPNSTSLPGTCTPGQVYVDTDATSGQRFNYCDSTNTWQALGGGGAAKYSASQGYYSASMTGSPVTMVTFSSVPALAAGKCYRISLVLTQGTSSADWAIKADSTEIAAPVTGNTAGQWMNEQYMYCNDAGSQTAQHMVPNVSGYTSAPSGGNSWVNYYAQTISRVPTSVNWSSSHNITVTVNGASGTAELYFASIEALD